MPHLTVGDFGRASAYARESGQTMDIGRSRSGQAQIVVGERSFGEGQPIASLRGASQGERLALLSQFHADARAYDKPTGQATFAYMRDRSATADEGHPLLLGVRDSGGSGSYGSMGTTPRRGPAPPPAPSASSTPPGYQPAPSRPPPGSAPDRSNLPDQWREGSAFMLRSDPHASSSSREEGPRGMGSARSEPYGSISDTSARWERGGSFAARPLRNLTGAVMEGVGKHGGELADKVGSRLADRYAPIPDHPAPAIAEPSGPHGRSTPMMERTMLLRPAEDRTRTGDAGLHARQKLAETLGSAEGGGTKVAEFGVSTGLSALVTLIENKIPVVGTITAAVKLGRLEHLQGQISGLADRAEAAYLNHPTTGSTDAQAAAALKELANRTLPLLKGSLTTQAVASLVPLPGAAFVASKIDGSLSGLDEAFQPPLDSLRHLAQGGNVYAQEFFQRILDLSSAEIQGPGGLTLMKDALQ